MTGLVHEMFRPLCHQLAERSPQYLGSVFPVCYRCAGFYTGILAQFIFLLPQNRWKGGLPNVQCTSIAVAPACVLYIDGIGNLLRLWASPDWLRAAAGAGMGLLVPLILLPLLPLRREPDMAPIVTNPHVLLWPAAFAALLLFFTARPASVAMFELLALIPALSFVLLISGIAALFAASRGPQRL